MLYLPIIISSLSIAFAYFLIRKIEKAPSGSAKMVEISNYIREGAIAYLKRQFKTVGVVAAVLFFILWISLGFKVGIGFLMGAAASAVAGIIGMLVSTKANQKVAEASKKGLKPALSLAFQGGSVTGLLCFPFLFFQS